MKRSWTDADGIVWTVEWRDATARAQWVGGGSVMEPAGLQFTCSAVTFRVPMAYLIDPRALPDPMLQRMVDRALD